MSRFLADNRVMVAALIIAGLAPPAHQVDVATITDNIANLTTPAYEPEKTVLAATGQDDDVSGIVTAAQAATTSRPRSSISWWPRTPLKPRLTS